MKVCPRCKIKKDESEFFKNRSTKDGLQFYCKQCAKKTYYDYHRKYIDKFSEKNLKNWIDYFTKKYNDIFKCEICGKELKFLVHRSISVNFDHKNGKNRIRIPSSFLRSHVFNSKNIKIWEESNFGILCTRCNLALPTEGRKEWLENAIKYI